MTPDDKVNREFTATVPKTSSGGGLHLRVDLNGDGPCGLCH